MEVQEPSPISFNGIESDINLLVKNMTEEELYSSFFGELRAIEAASLDSEPFGSPSSPETDSVVLVPIKPDPESPPPLARVLSKRRKNARKNAQESKKQRVSIKTEEEKKIDVMGRSSVKPEKHKKRLEANKKSAQASRERKKVLKNELEIKVQQLSEENKNLGKEIIELETENKVLKSEFIQLQRIISQSPALLNSTPTSPKKHDGDCPPQFSGAAFMYLIIVLQSFSQHFSSLLPESKGLEIPNQTITVR